jgi:hypothetical protein
MGGLRATRHRLQCRDGIPAQSRGDVARGGDDRKVILRAPVPRRSGGTGLIARVVTRYDDVALYPPAYFHPLVGEVKSNPDAPAHLKAAHLFAGTWVEDNRRHYRSMWLANTPG